ncbi:MAG: site-2 protease family protein [Sphingomonadaceae bacterium]
MNETLLQILLLVPGLIIAIVFHEVAHGLVARALGDPTAQEQHRLSLNPLRHVDPIGTIILPGFLALMKGPIFGWAKPVPVDFRRLNNPRRDMMLVAAAGPATNIVLGAIGAVLLGLIGSNVGPDSSTATVIFMQALVQFIAINCFLAFFNLLPIPPFDGSHILEGLLPVDWARQFARLRQAGMALFFLLIAVDWIFPQFDIIGRVVGPPVQWMMGIYQNIAIAVAGG